MKTLLYLVMVPVLYLYTWLLLRLNLQRGEPLPPGPRLLVANHPTTIDSFFVAWLAGGPACILITEDAFKVPLFGAYLRHAGHVPVVSGRGREPSLRRRPRWKPGAPSSSSPKAILARGRDSARRILARRDWRYSPASRSFPSGFTFPGRGYASAKRSAAPKPS